MSMNTIKNSKVFSLKEIASWTSKESGVSIPALQRGLVWSPQQTEFLWDSILRTFPIGGFVLSQNTDGSYYLMDGQQRYNAIRTGFTAPNENENIVLWIDLDPTISSKSTRQYFIKAITRNHPWGFKNDDECSVLSAHERREALKSFGHEGENIFRTKISLLETFPIESRFPIPLSFLLNAPLDSEVHFSEHIIKKIDSLSENWKEQFKWHENDTILKTSKLLKNYYNLIEELLNSNPYIVPCSVLSQEAISKETDKSTDKDKTNLEILFTRLNKGGTPISQDDLYYSAIKAYWETIKETIDNIAEDKMPPQYLAMLFFRLTLTIKDETSTKFVGNLTIKQIRQYARDEQIKDFIDSFVIEDANRIINTVYEALSEIPKYLIMKIITRKREIFLLLMYFAYRGFDLKELKAANLAMYLYWFSPDWIPTVNKLYSCFRDNIGEIVSNQKIHEAKQILSELITQGRIINVYEPNEIKIDVDSLKRPKIENAIHSFWNIISDYKHNSFLIFAEREFINTYFPEYNPTNIKGWDKTNCPWDYDHIIPKSWSEYQLKSNPYKSIVDYWLWRTGNFAAIPFEENRSKNNKDDYEFYSNNNAEKLYFDKQITTVTNKVIANEVEARTFANITFNRTIKIYDYCYNFISPWLPILSSEAAQRKELFLRIQSQLKDFKIFYVFGIKECIITSETDWNQKCLSLALPVNSDLMISLTWNIGQYKEQTYEIGLRKNYSQAQLNPALLEEIKKKNILEGGSSMGDWWYLYRLYKFSETTEQKCIEVLKLLYEEAITFTNPS